MAMAVINSKANLGVGEEKGSRMEGCFEGELDTQLDFIWVIQANRAFIQATVGHKLAALLPLDFNKTKVPRR